MNRTICVGLMALQVYLYNSGVDFASSSDVPLFQQIFPITTTYITASINAQSHRVPGKVSARDEQSGDCLRTGTCQD
ncbi:hypothetical protein NIES4074_22930 [Cylindrospermum sp. NIES-4074]|nr:hypothetical protein NIES4074_22930 [Cylindrospermum sp. NIES-4074]